MTMISTGRVRHLTSRQVAELVATESPLTPEAAGAIASWYQSPECHGVTFALLASGRRVSSADLLDAINYEMDRTKHAMDRTHLLALAEWAAGFDG